MSAGSQQSAERRWRSAVAVAAVLLGAGVVLGGQQLGAASTADSTFVPMSPCRLFDTRPAPQNVGLRAEPLGPDDTMEVQATGSSGNCSIPDTATAIVVNATAVGATAPSWAAFYPADTERPLASSLNYEPGASPTPNSIDVRLAADGRFEIYNRFGSVHVLGDVTGYYTGDVLDRLNEAIGAKADLSVVYTKAEVDALLAGLTPPSGYSDAEIDAAIAAAVAGKADAGSTYTMAETDDLVAAAVAPKANAADVYTQAELDAMHQMLYTKDEVDELLNRQRVFTASFGGNGVKLTDGPYVSTRLAVGDYQIDFDLAEFHIPADAAPIVVAQNRCFGSTYLASKFPTIVAGELVALEVHVFGHDTAGAFTDCPMDVLLRLDS